MNLSNYKLSNIAIGYTIYSDTPNVWSTNILPVCSHIKYVIHNSKPINIFNNKYFFNGNHMLASTIKQIYKKIKQHKENQNES